MKAPQRSVRFSLVVNQCGKPHTVTLWGKPDKRFLTAVRDKRVLTISLPPNNTKKDFGIVGFHQEKNASYLVFPKTLRQFDGYRVVGIKYELIEGTQVSGQLATTKRQKAGRPAPPAKPALSRFRVTTRFTATVEIMEEIEAANEAGARSLAAKAAGQKEIDFSETRPTLHHREGCERVAVVCCR